MSSLLNKVIFSNRTRDKKQNNTEYFECKFYSIFESIMDKEVYNGQLRSAILDLRSMLECIWARIAEYSYSEYENICIQTHTSIDICLGLYILYYLYLLTSTYFYLHLTTSTFLYLLLPTSTYFYQHLPSSTYFYLLLPTSTYIYLHLPTCTYFYLYLLLLNS